eukprot:jgi/Psemu1/50201/gm1.50201_g
MEGIYKIQKVVQEHPADLEQELRKMVVYHKKETARLQKMIQTVLGRVPEIKGDGFEPHLIDWCSKKSMTSDVPVCKEIYIWSFQKGLHSLLTNVTLVKEKNLSFPHAEDPTSPVHELHHGEWLINTWGKRCTRDSNEILVPIILYMDGITIDDSDAWETIYFHPTSSCDKGNESIDNVNNLHSGLRCALSSLKEACDTSQQNQLCGHYQTANTKMISHGNNSRVNVLKIPVSIESRNMHVLNHKSGEEYQSVRLWKMSNFTSPTVGEGVNVEQYFKNVSHHRVHNGNAFHDLDFGENLHNIHLASPGERLHMHQLGCAKRAAETFCCQLLLSPRTTTNLENRSQKCEEEIDGRIYALELLLGMEEFLKYAGTFDEVFKEDNKGVLNLDKMVVHFINCINNYLQQSKGEGNNLVKNHMYFHLSQYMRLFGPPIRGRESSLYSMPMMYRQRCMQLL